MLAKVGTYTGTSSAQTISGVPFAPDAVLVKNSTNTADTYFCTKDMPTGRSMFVRSDSAGNTNLITGLTADGFTLGSALGPNRTGTLYYFLALKDDGAGDFKTFSYTGDATDDRLVFTDFKPDYALIKSDSNITGAQKFAGQASALATATSNVCSVLFQSGTDRSDLMGFFPNEIRVSNGSSSGGNLINVNTTLHYGLAFKNSANFIASQYTGTGAPQTIPLSFMPIFINSHAAASQPPVMQYQPAQAAGTTNAFDSAQTTGKITSVSATGFTLGSDASNNGNGVTNWYMAMGEKQVSNDNYPVTTQKRNLAGFFY